MSKSRLLIVDDDLTLLQILPQTLLARLYNTTIDTSPTVQDALDRIAAIDYGDTRFRRHLRA